MPFLYLESAVGVVIEKVPFLGAYTNEYANITLGNIDHEEKL